MQTPSEPAPLRVADRELVVESFELFEVPPRWLFLKVTTAGGLTGWGEPGVEGRARTVRAAVEELGQYVIGRPANRVEDIWQVLFRGGFYRGGPVLMSALSGIDQALWDIKGKALDVPVYELLGGPVRSGIDMYGWIGGDRPDDVAEAARARVDAGFTAVKMNASAETLWVDGPDRIQEMADRMRVVRDAVGPEIGIGVDFHGRLHRGTARRAIEALEPYGPMFIEEPLGPGHDDLLPELRAVSAAPIATGERLYSRWDFKDVIPHVDIIQPDLSHAGGISEVRRIAAMAEAYDVALAPHCPLGPLALAASLHVDFASINALIQESSLGIHYNEGADLLDYVTNPEVFDLEDGRIKLPTGPGLGVIVDEGAVREADAKGHDWTGPIWRRDDGSFADW
ncbi:MAG: galactonate dehydratase [Rhodothermales bacterium]